MVAGGSMKKAPAAGSASATAVKKHPFIASQPKNFGLGGAPRPAVDLSRCVRWPRNVQLQRKRAVLLNRLKVPPQLNQFRHTANKNEATQLFRLLAKYRPESTQQKSARRLAEAEKRAAGDAAVEKSKRPVVLEQGLNHIVSLIESQKAKLVVIAHDVNPIETVVFLPALCRKMQVPYCIVKGKARLGPLVHLKNAAVVALSNVNKEDQAALDQLITVFNSEFINNAEVRRRWGN